MVSALLFPPKFGARTGLLGERAESRRSLAWLESSGLRELVWQGPWPVLAARRTFCLVSSQGWGAARGSRFSVGSEHLVWSPAEGTEQTLIVQRAACWCSLNTPKSD